MKNKSLKIAYGIAIVVLYLMFGILLLNKFLLGSEQRNTSMTIFALVVIAYGLFRGYRVYKSFQDRDENETE